MLSQLSTKTQRTESHWATWLDSYEGLPPPAAVQTHTRSSKLYRRLDDFAELPAGLFLAGLLALGAHYVKGGVNLDHFGGAKVDQLVKG